MTWDQLFDLLREPDARMRWRIVNTFEGNGLQACRVCGARAGHDCITRKGRDAKREHWGRRRSIPPMPITRTMNGKDEARAREYADEMERRYP